MPVMTQQNGNVAENTEETQGARDVDRMQNSHIQESWISEYPVEIVRPRMDSRRYSPLLEDATISPDQLTKSLWMCKCIPITKEVYIPAVNIEKADILFCIDLTSSMDGIVLDLKNEIDDIISQLGLLVPDLAYGLISFEDYYLEDYGSYCGYRCCEGYGSSMDLPYRLNQPISADANLTKTAVAGLVCGHGADGPESYSRALYETYADPAISWRTDSKKIVINFGDYLPHDCDVYQCIGGAVISQGVDPGRNGIPGDSDDLAILDVIDGMAENNITLIHVCCGYITQTLDVWDCWAGMTPSGSAVDYLTYPGTLTNLIHEKIGAVSGLDGPLTLQTDPQHADWIVNLTPAAYEDFTLPGTFTFNFDLCIPFRTDEGVHQFDICAVCNEQVVACEHDVITNLGYYSPLPNIYKIEYSTVNFSWSSWTIRICLFNSSSHVFSNAELQIVHIAGDPANELSITDPYCNYPLLDEKSCGATGDVFDIDLTDWHRYESFVVGMQLILRDDCGNGYSYNKSLILQLNPPKYMPWPYPIYEDSSQECMF
ncbi:MAG: hypothetical protein KOO63_14295 [Bacteroidales bacterium]|nr:hypothetical protein [Candidatus Latescibacterota bacterium]